MIEKHKPQKTKTINATQDIVSSHKNMRSKDNNSSPKQQSNRHYNITKVKQQRQVDTKETFILNNNNMHFFKQPTTHHQYDDNDEYGKALDITNRQSQLYIYQNDHSTSPTNKKHQESDIQQYIELNLQRVRVMCRDNAPTPPNGEVNSFSKQPQQLMFFNQKTPKQQPLKVDEKVYCSEGYKSNPHKMKMKEMTYESEHSSIFNENITLKDYSNRNNLPIQYGRLNEESKKGPSDPYTTYTEQQDLNTGTMQQTDMIPPQQFLELNLRMSNLTILNEKTVTKNLFLRTIDIRNNQIAKLPDSICDLAILWKLRLDYNLLTELPQSIGKLQRLEVLTMSNNKIGVLPRSIYQIGDRLEWFQYLHPPMNKVLKDERGQLMIKDFQKFCKVISEIELTQKCSFTHFLAYFHKLQDIDQLQNLNIFAKQRSVVHYQCLNGHLHLLKELMATCSGIDINYCDNDKTTPLTLAFKNRQNAVISYMMKFPIVNFNKGSQKYGFPLHLAIKNHEFNIALKILKPKYVININARDEEGNNALHYLMNHFGYDPKQTSKIGNILLKKGIDPNILNKQELSPIHYAIKNYQHKSLKYALDYNQFLRSKQFAREENEGESTINPNTFSLSKAKETQKSNAYLMTRKYNKFQLFDFNSVGKNKMTPLHYAVFNNNLIAVEVLLFAQKQEGIDIFARDADFKLAQELCPFNSPIFKMILKRQNLTIRDHLNSNSDSTEDEKMTFTHQILNKKTLRQQNKEQNLKIQMLLKSKGLSNNQTLKKKDHEQNQKRILHFGAQEESSDEDINFNQIKLRDSMINDYKQNSSSSSSKGHHQGKTQSNKFRLGGMIVSKTEKNLHSVHLMNVANSQGQVPLINLSGLQDQTQAIADRTQEGAIITKKQSPRILQSILPLAPKQLLNSEEGYEGMDIEDIFKQDLGDYPHNRDQSNDVNFCTDDDEVESDSPSLVEEAHSDENVTSSVSSCNDLQNQVKGKRLQENYFSYRRNSDRDLCNNSKDYSYQINPHSINNSKVFEIIQDEPYLQNQYQSAPISEQKQYQVYKEVSPVNQTFLEKNVHSIRSKAGQGHGQGLVLQNERYNLKIKSEQEDDDDFCCADEDAEAGNLGQIANKINKFENHNIYQEMDYNTNNERVVMKNIIGQLSEQKQKRKINKEKLKIQLQLKQNHHHQKSLQPFVQRDLFEDMRMLMETPQNEKIFEKAELSQDSQNSGKKENEGNVFDTVDHAEDLATPKMDFTNNKESIRNIMERDCLFVNEFAIIENSNNVQKRNSKMPPREERLFSMQGGLGKLENLNRECNFDEKEKDQNSVLGSNWTLLNDPDVSLFQKYQIIYKAITFNKRSTDEKVLKKLYELIDQCNGNVILKADLSYLLSISKSKEMLPTFDQALHKLKHSKPLSPKSQSKQKHEPKQESTHVRQKSKCNPLLLYETSNAYDYLMKDLMHNTNQMMEKCNQKIHFERERSREKMNLKQIYSQSNNKNHNSSLNNKSNLSMNMYQESSSPNAGMMIGFIKLNQNTSKQEMKYKDQNLSIREVPEFKARLYKSPSTQNFNQYRKLDGFVTQGPSNVVVNLDSSNASSNVVSDQNLMLGSGLQAFQKKTSFTPKGSSGQVFLAFQRQKQSQGLMSSNQKSEKVVHLSGDTHQNINQDISLPPQIEDIQTTVINLCDENYNETILRVVQRPNNFQIERQRKGITHYSNTTNDESEPSTNNNTQFRSNQQSIFNRKQNQVQVRNYEASLADPELIRQKVRLEQYILKRQDELKKQSALSIKQKDMQSLSKQKQILNSITSFPKQDNSTVPTLKTKNVTTKKLKSALAFEKLQSPSKIIDLTNESNIGIGLGPGLEDKLRKNLLVHNSSTTSKKQVIHSKRFEDNRNQINKSQYKMNNKSISTYNNGLNAQGQGQGQGQSTQLKLAMKKSISTSKLASEQYSYLHS